MISTLATFPPFLHKDIIEYLSTSFLPMAICEYKLKKDSWWFIKLKCYAIKSYQVIKQYALIFNLKLKHELHKPILASILLS